MKTAVLIEAMHARILPAALHQHVVTIPRPGGGKRRADNGTAMAATLKIGMSDHVFEESMPPSGTQQVWRRDQHAGRNDPGIHGGYEHRNAAVGQRFLPDLLGPLDRLRARAHFGDPKEIEQRS